MPNPVRNRITIRLRSVARPLGSGADAEVVLDRLGSYKEIILDFEGIEAVGDDFLRQVFQQWASLHPTALITPINMSVGIRPRVMRYWRGEAPGR